ncbi:uncharacterized protein J4E79_006461 [Alternaria viburni]|uniref:uncharacterized protein n=1 Tax=Alternaria viburni TaxID=566460 RepID=UPI0020C33CCB|nr:uncharacterized protein J4E79_006461 [Alternaria viburni]KAI4658703.1 hypothetical protein J4E79_006461 [Alternaria viburni]
MSQTTLTNQQTSPLLRLPAELRNIVYTYVGLATIIRPYRLETTNTANTAPIKYALELPGLLSASAQIRQEATPLIYAHALFDFNVFNLFSWPPISTCHHEISGFITSISPLGFRDRAYCVMSYNIILCYN